MNLNHVINKTTGGHYTKVSKHHSARHQSKLW
ncbi:hypothetical protein kac65v162_gp117 [Nodularia phage vB_NspS-kac65v162]|uniref:Uncharacterized protein n=5 Tax=Ravarandavirus TaxID=2843444 RepID=A0A482MK79_9CAUD|nr:hypothetical protein HWC12_gp200 [Nodularia phage vB_NspS-kac65v151]YP_009844928.1 hypothetical protein HWC13_gp192 [Nodularia phage vB_NspS-kac68v161]QBQ73355.1 hypothetical protein kac65v161_gp117 [Nodularia phage vB_NspS-kac65v161]QBQ73561.1 hypothetical protein kac65v162_gp117 [Nodularia phage vB_NspS-kac65v162]QBQ73965.1 hypothetical protein kac68v162_gp117 [Nodularia phage vB_NspS-kac68v162]QBQ73147.1 hypothetical protein kac65v151_gp117 [Nodularia phage vB_NspS-kac65v151]QBQ73769.1 